MSSLDRSPLFTAGDAGYFCFRIPALVTTGEAVLAFCEGRRNDCSDVGDIDIVLKRSTDGGRTWSEMQVVAAGEGRTSGNPCAVVDRSDGAVLLLFCRDNRRVLVTKSSDEGETWSETVDITEEASPPEWFYIGTGPGHGIQLGTGRLVIPCWVGDATRLHGEVQASYVFYSDDCGARWERSPVLDRDASDECEVVELADGALYLNARSRQGKRQRAFSNSEDGGASWSPVAYDACLPEPSCQGSLISIPSADGDGGGRVLLAVPASPESRSRLVIRASDDGGKTWPISRVLDEGSAAYSDLAALPDSDVLCLYEARDYRELSLARLSIEWLTDGTECG